MVKRISLDSGDTKPKSKAAERPGARSDVVLELFFNRGIVFHEVELPRALPDVVSGFIVQKPAAGGAGQTGIRRAAVGEEPDVEVGGLEESATALVAALEREMNRTSSGSVFGAFIERLTVDPKELEDEVRKIVAQVTPMSIKTSDKAKRIIVHVLKWWTDAAAQRVRTWDSAIPSALA
jgi:hypothetical protein